MEEKTDLENMRYFDWVYLAFSRKMGKLLFIYYSFKLFLLLFSKHFVIVAQSNYFVTCFEVNLIAYFNSDSSKVCHDIFHVLL